MNNALRIASVWQSATLPESITGLPTFQLNRSQLPDTVSFDLPNNLRLGHLIERVVAGLLQASSNYQVLHENLQIKKRQVTIGELDFLIQEKHTQQVFHVELAYKFYLFDPALDQTPLHHWIGPNRKDTLVEKLQKLHAKQFTLLHTPEAQDQLPQVNVDTVQQQLCYLVHLYVPYHLQNQDFKTFQPGVCGYYLLYEEFLTTINADTQYYLPHKREWGMLPNASAAWQSYAEMETNLAQAIEEKQSVLVWQKKGAKYEQLFVVWWC